MGCSHSYFMTQGISNDESDGSNDIRISKKPLLSDDQIKYDDESINESDSVIKDNEFPKRLSNSSSNVKDLSSVHKIKTRSTSLPINPLQNVLESSLEEQVNMKLQRAIVDLPVSSDLPRMISRTIVFDKNGEKLFDPNDESIMPIEKIKKLFLTLSKSLCVNFVTENVESQYDILLPRNFEGDTTIPLKNVINNLIGENNPVSNILKSLNQAIIAPAIMKLKITLMQKELNYKDSRNKWEIEIHLNDDDVTIKHKKFEKSIPEEFEFEWHLSLHFDTNVNTIDAVDFKIVNIIFDDPNTPNEKRSQIEEKLKAFL